LRKLILAAVMLAAAGPVAAQPSRRPVPLPHPEQIGQMGDRVSDVADAIMDVDVGPVVDAIDPRSPRRERTLGDFASRRDPYARERMHDSIARTSARLNATARELAAMAPVMMRSFEDARRRLKAAMNAPMEPGDYRPDYRSAPPPSRSTVPDSPYEPVDAGEYEDER
jgi:hypothetical protein